MKKDTETLLTRVLLILMFCLGYMTADLINDLTAPKEDATIQRRLDEQRLHRNNMRDGFERQHSNPRFRKNNEQLS
jgi:hypothetical protein